jgi:hypothetical protein
MFKGRVYYYFDKKSFIYLFFYIKLISLGKVLFSRANVYLKLIRIFPHAYLTWK